MLRPVVEGTRGGLPPALAVLPRRLPFVRFVPAYLVGIGFRPERAPGFARRPTG
jgi:hypothetical protein